MSRPRLAAHAAGLLSLLALAASSASAQDGLPVLRASPYASVTQRIAFTDVTVRFHRPGVRGREVFGSVVPYGQLWRAGANENTTVTFGSDVSVDGQPVPAGTYGFHVLPFRDKPWTVVFSKQTNLWGSFGYDRGQDALRVEVTPEKTAHVEWMDFRFSPVDDDSCVMALCWAETSLPVTIDVDLEASKFGATRALIEERGADDPALLLSAAQWAADEGTGLEDALGWVDRAIAQEKTFTNLGLKARILEGLGRADEAAPLLKEAWLVATEEDLGKVGGQLMSNKQYAEAVPVFELSVRGNPESWKAHDQLAEAYLKSGDAAKALETYAKALELAPDEATKTRLSETLEKLRGG